MVNSLVNLFAYDFMQHAFMVGTLAAILSGAIGYFIVLRQLAFASHAISHIGFAGAAAALLCSISPFSGQLIVSIISGLSMGSLADRLIKHDFVIGVVLAFFLGLGSLLLHFYTGYAGATSTILFGDLLGVSVQQIYQVAALTFASLSILSIIARPLLFASLEPEIAQAKGVSLRLIGCIFFVLMAISICLASQVVGILLVFTLLIGPAGIAQLWTKRFNTGFFLSIALAIILVWLSILLAYLTDWPVSFWMSSLVAGTYGLSLLVSNLKVSSVY